MIIAFMTSLRDNGHSSGIWLDSSIIDSSCGSNSSIPKYFASSYTPGYENENTVITTMTYESQKIYF